MVSPKIALLGAGAMGSIMARDIYPSLADVVEVVAVIDRHPERRAPLAESLGARHYGSLAEAVAAEDLTGVDIRLQHAAHADAAIEAMEFGLDVLVEKPLALSLADCGRIQDAAMLTGATVAVAENYPHLRAVLAAADTIRSGAVGQVLSLRTTRAYTLDGVWAQTTWRQGDNPAAGILWDQGTHHTSLLRALGAEIVAVTALAGSHPGVSGAETVALTFETASGVIAQSLYLWGTPMVENDVEASVWGTDGRIDITVSYNDDTGRATLSSGSESRGVSELEGYYDSHRLIVEDWLSAIAGGTPPRVGLAEAIDDVRIVLAAQRSLAMGGQRVALADLR